ncbi:MAG: hypothetical protein JOZ14_15840 [Acidobacteria bacterium]|nr:hypothetical protein [Acidobacteriota bacterium]
MQETPRRARLFIALIASGGSAVAGYAIFEHQPFLYPSGFLCFLTAALLTSRLKLKLPGLNGNMSVNLPVILLAVAKLSLLEALVIACASALTQSLPRERRELKPVQLLFNCCNMALAVGLAALVLRWVPTLGIVIPAILLPAAAAAAVLVAQTVPVAAVISLTEGAPMAAIWHRIFLLSFPYYLASAVISSLGSARRPAGWLPIVLVPAMFAVYASYREYFAGSCAVPAADSRQRA